MSNLRLADLSPNHVDWWVFEQDYAACCGQACTPSGCPCCHPSGTWELLGPRQSERGYFDRKVDVRLAASAPVMLSVLRQVQPLVPDGLMLDNLNWILRLLQDTILPNEAMEGIE